MATPTSAPLPKLPSLDESGLLNGVSLSPGAHRIFQVLYDLAARLTVRRGYGVIPHSVAMHLPQQLLALRVGYTTRHVRRLISELKSAELLGYGAHASRVWGMGLWDGCLFAVKTRPVPGPVAKMRADVWHHPWRDFESDIKSGNTMQHFLAGMSELHPDDQKTAVKDALDAWAVNPGNLNSPVACSSDMGAAEGLDTVLDVPQIAYRLGDVATIHPSRRARLVGQLASALSHALKDRHSRAWYCKLIWNAWNDEVEGRGGLQVLSTTLLRLQADIQEWSGLRTPPALLNARLSPSRPCPVA